MSHRSYLALLASIKYAVMCRLIG